MTAKPASSWHYLPGPSSPSTVDRSASSGVATAASLRSGGPGSTSCPWPRAPQLPADEFVFDSDEATRRRTGISADRDGFRRAIAPDRPALAPASTFRPPPGRGGLPRLAERRALAPANRSCGLLRHHSRRRFCLRSTLIATFQSRSKRCVLNAASAASGRSSRSKGISKSRPPRLEHGVALAVELFLIAAAYSRTSRARLSPSRRRYFDPGQRHLGGCSREQPDLDARLGASPLPPTLRRSCARLASLAGPPHPLPRCLGRPSTGRPCRRVPRTDPWTARDRAPSLAERLRRPAHPCSPDEPRIAAAASSIAVACSSVSSRR